MSCSAGSTYYRSTGAKRPGGSESRVAIGMVVKPTFSANTLGPGLYGMLVFAIIAVFVGNRHRIALTLAVLADRV